MACDTVSNGYLMDDSLAARIVGSGIDGVGISIDSSDASLNDKIRGKHGAFDRATNAIRLLVKHKQSIRSATPDLHISCTVSSLNFDRLPDMPALAKSIGIKRIYFNYLSIVTDDVKRRSNELMGEEVIGVHTFSGIDTSLFLQADQLERYNGVMDLLTKSAVTSGIMCDMDPALVKGDLKVLSTGIFPVTSCNLPWWSLIVSPTGNVLPCVNLTGYILGNIRDENFYDIWNGEKALKMRKHLKKKLLPVCGRCCIIHEGVPPLWRRVLNRMVSRKQGDRR